MSRSFPQFSLLSSWSRPIEGELTKQNKKMRVISSPTTASGFVRALPDLQTCHWQHECVLHSGQPQLIPRSWRSQFNSPFVPHDTIFLWCGVWLKIQLSSNEYNDQIKCRTLYKCRLEKFSWNSLYKCFCYGRRLYFLASVLVSLSAIASEGVDWGVFTGHFL